MPLPPLATVRPIPLPPEKTIISPPLSTAATIADPPARTCKTPPLFTSALKSVPPDTNSVPPLPIVVPLAKP